MRRSCWLLITAGFSVGAVASPSARADDMGYQVNVSVRPSHNFPDADALAYGRGICDKVVARRAYSDLVAHIKTDFNTSDDCQTSCLINQAVSQLGASSICQLHNSAAHYCFAPQ